MIADHEARRIAAELLDVPPERVAVELYDGHWMATATGPEREPLIGGSAVVIRPDGEARRTSASLPPRLRIRQAAGD
jgi:hypothetical protein